MMILIYHISYIFWYIKCSDIYHISNIIYKFNERLKKFEEAGFKISSLRSPQAGPTRGDGAGTTVLLPQYLRPQLSASLAGRGSEQLSKIL
jgi:hypothetical protein